MSLQQTDLAPPSLQHSTRLAPLRYQALCNVLRAQLQTERTGATRKGYTSAELRPRKEGSRAILSLWSDLAGFLQHSRHSQATSLSPLSPPGFLYLAAPSPRGLLPVDLRRAPTVSPHTLPVSLLQTGSHEACQSFLWPHAGSQNGLLELVLEEGTFREATGRPPAQVAAVLRDGCRCAARSRYVPQVISPTSPDTDLLLTPGAFPVAGNGPSIYETLQKSGKFSQSHLSLSEASAPSPTIPRFKDLGTERPNTAPNGVTNGSSLASDRAQKRQSLRAPHSAHRKPRIDSLRPPPPNVEAAMTVLAPPDVDIKPLPAPPRTAHAHSRTFSMRSEASKAFVDLLDAQSEMKPTDFRSRVKATGTRDYGEDVADRNMGENGVDLHSHPVRAFYAATGEPTPAELERIPFSGAGARPLSMTKHASMESGLRNMVPNPPPPFTFPMTTAPVERAEANTSRPVSKGKTLRRQSLNTYLPGPPPDSMSSQPSKARPKSFFHRPAMAPEHNLQISPRRANLHAPGWETSSQESASPALLHSAKMVPSTRGKRESMLRSRPAELDEPALVPTEEFQFHFQQNEQPASVYRQRSSSRGSVASSAFASPTRRASRRHSLHTIHSSISSSIASRETPTSFTPLDHPMARRRRPIKADEDVDSAVDAGGDAAPSPC
jgi:hypothetical protein